MSTPLTPEDLVNSFPGTNRQTWAQHRYRGTGPKFFKVGRKVYYRPEDVAAWIENSLQTRTDDEPQVA